MDSVSFKYKTTCSNIISGPHHIQNPITPSKIEGHSWKLINVNIGSIGESRQFIIVWTWELIKD